MKLYVKDKPIEPWELHGPDAWYLGSPYSLYTRGIEAAFEDVCRIAGWLIENKVKVLCPIAHSHAIAMNSMLDPLDHGIWMDLDKPLMEATRGLILAEMEGWDKSYGVGVEFDYFTSAGKPIVHLRGVN